MHTIHIEWKHLDLEHGTCLRCSKTGKTLHEVITELKMELQPKNVNISFTETKLSEEQIHQSNMILINGSPLERILSGAEAGETYCASCSCLTGKENYCRTIKYNGETFEEIPEILIRMAVLKILQINDKVSNI
ncbi:MAG: DUF2703 domain-containing protein [Thermoplasmatota archaeon]